LENNDVLEAYQTIRKEIEQYDPELLKKRELVLLTKADLKNDTEVKEAKKKLKKIASTIYAVSLLKDEDIKFLEKLLLKELSA
jgi:GTP-binding protein